MQNQFLPVAKPAGTAGMMKPHVDRESACMSLAD